MMPIELCTGLSWAADDLTTLQALLVRNQGAELGMNEDNLVSLVWETI